MPHLQRLAMVVGSARAKILPRFLSNPTRRLARESRGSQLVEFAIVVPLLITLVMGIIAFGQAFSLDQTLTNAAAAGAQALSIAAGLTSNPCTTVSSAAAGISPTLNTTNLKYTIIVTAPTGGTASPQTLASNQANPTCAAASPTATPASYVQANYNANVTLTYPCAIVIYGINFVPNCTLTAQTTEVIQ